MKTLIVTKEKARAVYPLQQNPVPRRKSPGQERVQPSSRARTAGRPAESLLLCVFILLLIAISIGLIAQYSQVVALNYQIQQVDQQIAQLQKENERLALDVRSMNSLERLESIAVHELGLQYPEQKQWLRLSARGD